VQTQRDVVGVDNRHGETEIGGGQNGTHGRLMGEIEPQSPRITGQFDPEQPKLGSGVK
jgi:hypothetical protein